MTTSSAQPRPAAVEAVLPVLLKQLKLACFRSHWQSHCQQAEAEGSSPSQFLYALCEQEDDHRQIAGRQRLLRDAHLPWQKGLDGFDHQRLEVRHWQELEVLSSSHTWQLQAENLLLFGPNGVGTT
jgi:DNA replication protein DnaC